MRKEVLGSWKMKEGENPRVIGRQGEVGEIASLTCKACELALLTPEEVDGFQDVNPMTVVRFTRTNGDVVSVPLDTEERRDFYLPRLRVFGWALPEALATSVQASTSPSA